MTKFFVICEIEVEAENTTHALRKIIKQLGQVEDWEYINEITYTDVRAQV